VEENSILELQQMMETGLLNARSLVAYYLERVEKIDRGGPRLNAVIELNPEAMDIAAELDEERQNTGPRSRLHGLPLMLKDNIDTAGKMTTTAGSLALQGSIATQDAFIAANLRQAGAIILGKTNLSEWANFRSPHSSSGWSSRGGQTRNPYILDRNPCGSSSGSAVAVAANLCAAAIGTETDGSIICPSHANGIVGIKPTVGLASRRGIIPISSSQDSAGPMGRSVSDAAVLLGALTGIDPEDSATKASEGRVHTDYVPFLDKGGLQGARIGIARNYFGFDGRVDAIIERCIELMKDQGAVIVDPADIQTKDDIGEHEYEVLLYEFKNDLNDYLSRLGPEMPVHSLKDVIEFNEREMERVMPFFGQERMTAAEDKGTLDDHGYQEARKLSRLLAGREGIDAVIAEHKLDVIVAPSGGPAWTTDLVNGDHHSGSSSRPAAAAGYPNITVPAGFIHGLPVGISFFAGAFQEPVLIKVAYAFEQVSRVRRSPDFLPTVDLEVHGNR
jgi:amidase